MVCYLAATPLYALCTIAEQASHLCQLASCPSLEAVSVWRVHLAAHATHAHRASGLLGPGVQPEGDNDGGWDEGAGGDAWGDHEGGDQDQGVDRSQSQWEQGGVGRLGGLNALNIDSLLPPVRQAARMEIRHAHKDKPVRRWKRVQPVAGEQPWVSFLRLHF